MAPGALCLGEHYLPDSIKVVDAPIFLEYRKLCLSDTNRINGPHNEGVLWDRGWISVLVVPQPEVGVDMGGHPHLNEVLSELGFLCPPQLPGFG